MAPRRIIGFRDDRPEYAAHRRGADLAEGRQAIRFSADGVERMSAAHPFIGDEGSEGGVLAARVGLRGRRGWVSGYFQCRPPLPR